MADILIRGMEIPKSCDECRLFNESWCMALSVENWRKSYNKPPECGRLPDCPIVPIPEGHGRLIDADTVVKTICNSCDGACDVVQCDCLNCKADCRCDIVKEISDAPTIIEADIEWKMKNCCCFSNTDQAEGGMDDV